MNDNDDVKQYSATSKSNTKSNIIGFVLSVILTIIPFWIVIDHSFSNSIILKIVIISAVIQILLQLIYFLHLNIKSEGGWNIISLVFSAIVILIIITGSMWIMSNLNYNMMMT